MSGRESIYWDARWHGGHGIGRFGRETLRRTKLSVSLLGSKVSPLSIRDLALAERRRLSNQDIIYSPGFNAGLAKVRQLVTIHDLIHLNVESERSQIKTIYYNTLLKPVIRKTGMVLTVSSTSRNAIAEWLGDDDVEVINVGNGISSAFRTVNRTLFFDTVRVLVVSNLKPHKNLNTLLAAIALAPQTECTFVVPGGDALPLKKLVSQGGLSHRITVRSGLSDEEMATEYANADYLAFPSTVEGFGLPIVESLASGTQVLYSRECESAREIASKIGIEVSDGLSVDAWASALNGLDKPEAKLRLPPAWFENYSWDRVSENVDQAILCAAGRQA